VLGNDRQKALLPEVERPMKKRDPIPSSDNVEELAEFWQTHSLTDYEDLMVEVPGPLLVRKEKAVEVHLKLGEAETLQVMAEAKGVSTGELIHTWVAQKTARHKDAKRTNRTKR